MSTDDALYRFRLRVFALAEELGNARAACRAMGIHPSTYYRWRRQLLRFGPEIRRYAFDWGDRVLMRGGRGRVGQVTPPAWRSTRSR